MSQFQIRQSESQIFVGQTENKQPEYYGTLLQNNQFFWTGNFHCGFIEGFGKLYSAGKQYEGGIVAGKFDGIGRYTDQNRMWLGEFKQNVFIKGQYSVVDGGCKQVYKGTFVNNKIKSGIVYYETKQLSFKIQSSDFPPILAPQRFKLDGYQILCFKHDSVLPLIDFVISLVAPHRSTSNQRSNSNSPSRNSVSLALSDLKTSNRISSVSPRRPQIFLKAPQSNEFSIPQISSPQFVSPTSRLNNSKKRNPFICKLTVHKTYLDGSTYLGETLNLTPNGNGTLILKQKDMIYQGTFTNGAFIQGRRMSSAGVEMNGVKLGVDGKVEQIGGVGIKQANLAKKLVYERRNGELFIKQDQIIFRSNLDDTLTGFGIAKCGSLVFSGQFLNGNPTKTGQLQNNIYSYQIQFGDNGEWKEYKLLTPNKAILFHNNQYTVYGKEGAHMIIQNNRVLKSNQNLVFEYKGENRIESLKQIERLEKQVEKDVKIDEASVVGVGIGKQIGLW
ncbi:Hypothetical_protein [Hexamita inflata]|uniref:Hypothetical_protein n=1 Tax=Hexamita inflata TaxID=28002 RepID=A0AA86PSE6_9EUKA|nr:Hypothetical protein HINF_LOCUS30972 [Hexamita inflata]